MENIFQKSHFSEKYFAIIIRKAIVMENILPIYLQEIIFGSSDSTISKKISQLEKEGKIRKLAPRVYTGHNMEEMQKFLQESNAFLEPEEGRLTF